jgi:sterol desaturase/sphingolipid hydroxylase (fatty acid hydroxylase superfamily)
MQAFSALIDYWNQIHNALFEGLIQPVVFALGFGAWLEDAFEGTLWLMVGVLQILILWLLISPLQVLRPAESVLGLDAAAQVQRRKAVRVDFIYTLIHRLGLFRLMVFFSIAPALDALWGYSRELNFSSWQFDQIWPGVTDIALVSFVLYLLVFDFADYWIHRAQHQLRPWWALHALHHSQRHMTVWSDNRNHLLDDLLRDVLLATLAHLIGVPPGQFVALVVLTQLSESLQHANVRLHFGAWGERLWVSPRFHRLHHAVGLGHESQDKQDNAKSASPAQPVLGGHNFGVLLPWWDILFGTARFDSAYYPTGIRDQVEQRRDYGQGFWAQQWLGFKRLFSARKA